MDTKLDIVPEEKVVKPSFFKKHFPTFHSHWSGFSTKNKTVLKLLSVLLILVAIPLTVGFLQYQQNLTQEAARRCRSSNCIIIPTITPTQTTCLTGTTSFQGQVIPSQSGIFEVQFDVTPNSSSTDGDTGFSSVVAKAYADLAVSVEFDTSGNITARSGRSYQAVSAIPYVAGITYHLRLDIDIPNHKYNAYVTSPGASEKTIGTNLAFRSEQSTVSSLSYWNIIDYAGDSKGSQTVCNLTLTSTPEVKVVSPTPTPTNIPTPNLQKTVTLSPSNTAAQFRAAVADLSVDVIELTTGTYNWQNVQIDVDRTSRPLTIRPASGATATFVGPATTSGSIFVFGNNATAKYITMDGIKPDGFVFRGFAIVASGVFGVNGSDHVTFRNMTFQNLTRDPKFGNPSEPYKSWLFYIYSPVGRLNDHLVIDHITGLPPAVSRDISGIQISSTSVMQGTITLTNINLTNYDYAFYSEVPTTNLILDTWTITNCGNHSTPASVSFTPVNINGTYKNLHATLSDPLRNNSTGAMINGGGNSGL